MKTYENLSAIQNQYVENFQQLYKDSPHIIHWLQNADRRTKRECALGYAPFADKGVYSAISLYESMVVCKQLYPSDRPKSTPTRTPGDIKTFSKNSRMRAFRFLMSLRTRQLSPAIFITLTYHNEAKSESKLCKIDLEKFLRKLREHIPQIVYVWRLEYQQRGQPHFHLIVWSKEIQTKLNTLNFRRTITDEWMTIKGCRCKHCQLHSVLVKDVVSKRNAIAYLNKYIAKQDERIKHTNDGKFWGTSREAPIEPLEEYALTKSQHDMLKAKVREWMKQRAKLQEPFFEKFDENESYSTFIDIEEFLPILIGVLSKSPP